MTAHGSNNSFRIKANGKKTGQKSLKDRGHRNSTMAKKAGKKVLRKAGHSPEIHCMLAPTEQETLLLPTSVIAEIIDFQSPSPMEAAPPWLLGQIEWNNRQVPVFSFSALINAVDAEETDAQSKILIIKSLAESARVPYLGILISDLPRMLNLTDSDIVQTGDEQKSLGVFSRIKLEDQAAIVPDLDRLTHLVTHATYGALPITQIDS
jgi:chemosensory pili system protein ChpC